MKALLQSLFGDAIARMLSGAGLSVISYAALLPIVLGALNLVASQLNNALGDVASIVLLSGLGEAFSAIGSAILTRMAITTASSSIGKKAT